MSAEGLRKIIKTQPRIPFQTRTELLFEVDVNECLEVTIAVLFVIGLVILILGLKSH